MHTSEIKVLNENQICFSIHRNLKKWIEDSELKRNRKLNIVCKQYLKIKKYLSTNECRKIELLFNSLNHLD